MEHDPEGLWDSNAIAYSEDELQVVGVLVDNHASAISCKEYCRIRFSSL
jgi:hypothetical protein